MERFKKCWIRFRHFLIQLHPVRCQIFRTQWDTRLSIHIQSLSVVSLLSTFTSTWKTTGCISPKDSPSIDPPRWRAVRSSSLLNYPRTLLASYCLITRSVLILPPRPLRNTYVGERFSASVAHPALVRFHLSVMGIIIRHNRASIVDRYMSEILLAVLANHANWTRRIRGRDPR